MRLIDADALIDDIRKHSQSYFADDFAHEWVDKQPTVDAVEVVRCKDCKEYYLPFNHMQVEQLWTCMRYGLLRNADDFCSRGRRREE